MLSDSVSYHSCDVFNRIRLGYTDENDEILETNCTRPSHIVVGGNQHTMDDIISN
jgi:hypothetical protein